MYNRHRYCTYLLYYETIAPPTSPPTSPPTPPRIPRQRRQTIRRRRFSLKRDNHPPKKTIKAEGFIELRSKKHLNIIMLL